MMIDSVVLYILVIVFLPLTVIQGHRCARKNLFLAIYLIKFSIDLNGIWCPVETCWCDELILSRPFNIQERELYSCDSLKEQL